MPDTNRLFLTGLAARLSEDGAILTFYTPTTPGNELIVPITPPGTTTPGGLSIADATALIRPFARESVAFTALNSVIASDIANTTLVLVARAGQSDWEVLTLAEFVKFLPTPMAPSGGGLTETEVNALIKAGVYDWAEALNTSSIPANKLTLAPGLRQTQVDGRVRALVLNWAEEGNTDNIPANKLGLAPGLRQAQVDARIAVFARAATMIGDLTSVGESDVTDSNHVLIDLGKRMSIGAFKDVIAEEWAQKDNTDTIPPAKLPAATGGGGPTFTLLGTSTPTRATKHLSLIHI